MNLRFSISDLRWRKALRLVMAGAVLWMGFAALFRTDPGRGLLGRVIQGVAGERVQIAGAYGDWPFRGGLARLALADAQGPWLILSNVSWQVQAREVLGPPYRVRRVTAASVDWLRMPTRSTEKKSSHSPRLVVDTIRVEHFRPATNLVAGEHLNLGLQGAVEHAATGWFVLLEAREEAGIDTLDLALRTGERFQAALRLHEARGGVVTRRWLRGIDGVQADFYAERPASGWQGGVTVDAGTQGVVRAGWRQDTNKMWEVQLGATQVGGVVLGRPWRLASSVLQWMPAERRGRYQVAARYGDEPVWAEGALVRRPGGFGLPHMLVTARGLRARLSVQREDTWQGDGRIVLQSGGALSHWLGERWDVEGRLRFDWAGRRFHLDGAFPALRTPAGQMSGVEVALQSEDGTTLVVEGGVAALSRGPRAWLEQVHVRGSLQAQRPGWRVALDRLVARSDTTELALREPMAMTAGPSGLAWTATRFSAGEGAFVTEGTLHSNLQAEVSWTNVPLAILMQEHDAGLDGRLDGSLALQGTRTDPVLHGQLAAREVRVRQPRSGVELSPAEARLEVRAGAGRAAMDFTWSGWSDQPVVASGEGPLQWSLRPWRLTVPRDQPGHGTFRGALDLARLERVFDLRGARIRGQLAGALDLSGTLEDPVIQGRLSVADGQVDIPETGTALRDIQVVLEGDRERLLVRQGSASDGAAGRLGLEGSVLFDPARQFPVDVRLQLRRAELWRRGGSRAVLDGALDVQGDLQLLTLSGQLQAPVVQVKLGRRKPSVPRLPVTGLASTPVANKAAPASSAQKTRVKLDLQLKVPRTAEISGRGLEANWRADLRVGGRLAAPQLTGSVQAERGYFLFMGRRFDIESAWVGLDGRRPPQPTMNLLANCRARDMTARLHVSGPVLEPVLELTSDPAYPTDEVLSRLLFGKSADSISAFQAVSLAHGLNVLRGRGSSLDVLDRGQSLLRVDQLELRQDAEQGTVSSVSVGKYIGRRVFVQGETALDGSGDLIAVEVDLAPSLTLQTETSPGIREGIGLKWRRDY